MDLLVCNAWKDTLRYEKCDFEYENREVFGDQRCNLLFQAILFVLRHH